MCRSWLYLDKREEEREMEIFERAKEVNRGERVEERILMHSPQHLLQFMDLLLCSREGTLAVGGVVGAVVQRSAERLTELLHAVGKVLAFLWECEWKKERGKKEGGRERDIKRRE